MDVCRDYSTYLDIDYHLTFEKNYITNILTIIIFEQLICENAHFLLSYQNTERKYVNHCTLDNCNIMILQGFLQSNNRKKKNLRLNFHQKH